MVQVLVLGVKMLEEVVKRIEVMNTLIVVVVAEEVAVIVAWW